LSVVIRAAAASSPVELSRKFSLPYPTYYVPSPALNATSGAGSGCNLVAIDAVTLRLGSPSPAIAPTKECRATTLFAAAHPSQNACGEARFPTWPNAASFPDFLFGGNQARLT
jgi:hypothetical protein